jgi:steroid delta-isomerase-like uncharacterized protein
MRWYGKEALSMSVEENKAIARRVYEAFNQAISTGSWASLDELLTVDVVDHSPAPGQEPGREGIKKIFEAFRTAFPDLHFHVEDMIAEGDKVASRISTHGTHQGDFQGIPSTGKPVTQTGIDILRLAGGKVVERWGEFDNLGLLQQLGVIPAPGQAGG